MPLVGVSTLPPSCAFPLSFILRFRILRFFLWEKGTSFLCGDLSNKGLTSVGARFDDCGSVCGVVIVVGDVGLDWI